MVTRKHYQRVMEKQPRGGQMTSQQLRAWRPHSCVQGGVVQKCNLPAASGRDVPCRSECPAHVSRSYHGTCQREALRYPPLQGTPSEETGPHCSCLWPLASGHRYFWVCLGACFLWAAVCLGQARCVQILIWGAAMYQRQMGTGGEIPQLLLLLAGWFWGVQWHQAPAACCRNLPLIPALSASLPSLYCLPTMLTGAC